MKKKRTNSRCAGLACAGLGRMSLSSAPLRCWFRPFELPDVVSFLCFAVGAGLGLKPSGILDPRSKFLLARWGRTRCIQKGCAAVGEQHRLRACFEIGRARVLRRHRAGQKCRRAPVTEQQRLVRMIGPDEIQRAALRGARCRFWAIFLPERRVCFATSHYPRFLHASLSKKRRAVSHRFQIHTLWSKAGHCGMLSTCPPRQASSSSRPSWVRLVA